MTNRMLIFTAILMVVLAGKSFAEQPKIGGDFRYRQDRTDKEGSKSRYRHRLRARISLKGEAIKNWNYHFRLATGSTDPVSTNQTLDTGFSSKGINLDIARMKYKNGDFKAIIGKMKNPFYRPGKTELIWDGDLTPEGIALKYESSIFFANLAYFLAEERKVLPDAAITAAQVGANIESDSLHFTGGFSFYKYLDTKAQSTLFDPTDSAGNTIDSSGNYVTGFGLFETFFNLDLTNLGLALYGDYVVNTSATTAKNGFLLGTSYKLNSWKFAYNFRRVEADAVVGAFTDSDFKGGGTDGKGHEFGISYKLSKKQKIAFSHFINDTATKNGKNYVRTFLDYSIKF